MPARGEPANEGEDRCQPSAPAPEVRDQEGDLERAGRGPCRAVARQRGGTPPGELSHHLKALGALQEAKPVSKPAAQATDHSASCLPDSGNPSWCSSSWM